MATYRPHDIDIPLGFCETNDTSSLPECQTDSYFFQTSEEAEQLASADGLNVVFFKGNSRRSPGFVEYQMGRVFSNLFKPNAVQVEYDIELTDKPQYIPMRADLRMYCVSDVCEDVSLSLRNDFRLPRASEIEVGDFDEHGLYLNSSYCSVTRNLSHWSKMGIDIDGTSIQYASYLQPTLLPDVVFTGFPYNEDGCDQAIARVNAKSDVKPVNNPPIAVDDSAVTDKNTVKDISVLNNDSDIDNDTLSIVSIADETNGTFSIIDNCTPAPSKKESENNTQSHNESSNEETSENSGENSSSENTETNTENENTTGNSENTENTETSNT